MSQNTYLFHDFRSLACRVLQYANLGFLRTDFLREISRALLDASGCDVVELHLKERSKYFRCGIKRQEPVPVFSIETKPLMELEEEATPSSSVKSSGLHELQKMILHGFADSSSQFTKRGSFWTGDASIPFVINTSPEERADARTFCLSGEYRSLAIIPLTVNSDHERIGLLELKSASPNFFSAETIEFYEGIAQILGVALAHRSAQVGLRERVKELTCLYGIAQVAEQSDLPLADMFQAIVELLPPAWLYPEIAMASVTVDGRAYTTPDFHEGADKQTAAIVANGERCGEVGVVYADKMPELDEGPFLREERNLIEAVARELALIIERRTAEEEKIKLQDQLRHADRLATIGQLSAGVAHELNEPLGNILGFAQLAKKCPELPGQAAQDLDKIVNAAMYSREVIRKLMIFARQMPQQKMSLVNLNDLVADGLSFFESRCAKEGIELVRSLMPDLPRIIADPSQLTQVLINLVVNAIQSMPKGGKLTVCTKAHADEVLLTVEDTGFGMNEEVQKLIFVPFFTTKEVGQGTGLGLSVVHGIVSSYGGTIRVESKVGQGSRFEVYLPMGVSEKMEELE